MKKMTEKELNRAKKRKGTKVKRKLGAQPKKLEPVVEDDLALSGAKLPEAPAPVLPAPAPSPAPVIDPQPFAAMSASMASSGARMEKLVADNTKVLEAVLNKKSVAYRHTIKRTDKLLIKEVISTPMEQN